VEGEFWTLATHLVWAPITFGAARVLGVEFALAPGVDEEEEAPSGAPLYRAGPTLAYMSGRRQ
jgi:hypothetical protein